MTVDTHPWYAQGQYWGPPTAPPAPTVETIVSGDGSITVAPISGRGNVDLRAAVAGGVSRITSVDASVTLSPLGGTGVVDLHVPPVNAASLGWIDGTASPYSMLPDARTVADGVIAAGSPTLHSASLVFVAGDVGKVVNLSQTVSFTDGAIVSGTPDLTSASNPFTADDVGKTVHVDGAGTGGQTLLTTILAFVNAGHVTLTANAATTLVAGNGVCEVRAVFQSTLLARVDGTTGTLAAAPTFGFTAGSVVIGSDNRTGFAAAAAAAVAQQRPLYIPPGTYMLVLSQAQQAAMAVANDDFSLYGAGRDLARIITVSSDLVSSAQRELVNLGTGPLAPLRCEIQDITLDYISVAPNLDSYGPQMVLVTPLNGFGARVTVRRVSSTGFTFGVNMQGSSGTNTRIILMEQVSLLTRYIGIKLFTATGLGTAYDAELRLYLVRVEGTSNVKTQTNDNQYNAHNIYIHPSVSVDVDGLTLKSATLQTGQYGIHVNGSPTEPVKFVSLRRMRFDYTAAVPGNGTGILLAFNVLTASGGYITPLIDDCLFSYLRQGISENPIAYTCRACTFHTTNAAITQGTASATGAVRKLITECRFITDAILSNVVTVQTGHVGALTEFIGCDFLLGGASGGFQVTKAISQSANDQNIKVIGCRFTGLTGNTGSAIGFNRKRVLIAECAFIGEFTTNGALAVSGPPADDSADFSCVECDASGITAGPFIAGTANFGNGNLRGTGNEFASNALGPLNSGTGSGALVPPSRKNQTPVASASVLTLDWNHDSFDVSGVTAVDNIRVGNTANASRLRGGPLYLTATGAWTLKHNSGGTGNIRTQSGADRVMVAGQIVHLEADEKNGLWYAC